MANFINLHNHSEMSVRDGMIRIPQLVDKVASLGMNAVALSEHGNLSSFMDLYLAAKDKGVKAICACEQYLCWDHKVKIKGERKMHVLLIARDAVGYRNLLELCSVAATEGKYNTPRVDFDLLQKYHEGIICSSACSYKSALYLYDESYEWASRMARKFRTIFEDDFYIEIMPHTFPFQKDHNLKVVTIAQEQGIPIVATQDAHYLEKGDVDLHDVLMQIQGRQPYGVDSLFFPSQDESLEMFGEHKYLMNRVVFDAIDRTDAIAESVEDYGIELDKFNYPKFEVTDEVLNSLKGD